ncbi:MAG: sugar transporter [Tyzzerella sp.]|nr:sugar transporter [Tyzzerella sp.]
MSITVETAKEHANDPAVLCCRAEAGITIGPENLEDPAIFDELVDSGLLNLDGCLTIKEILGAKLTKTCDSLTPITLDVIDAPVGGDAPAEEAPAEAPVEAAPAAAVGGTVSGVGAVVKGGKLVLSIKEGKDIYIELPI